VAVRDHLRAAPRLPLTWFALALGAALLQAGQIAFVKGQARGIPPLIMVFWTQAVGVAAWAAGIGLTGGRIDVPTDMWGWIALAALCAGGYSYLLTRASGRGDISIVGPVLALAPVFSILPDWWLTDTLPRGLGWLGVGLAVVGTAGLSRTPARRMDLRGLFSRGDALDALGSAFFLGVLAAVDRHNVLAMHVPSYLVAAYAVLAVPLLALVLARTPHALVASLRRGQLARVLGHAVIVLTGTAFQVFALALAPAAYVSSIRRSSAVFTVLVGSAIFKEEGLAGRLGAALLTVLGAVCLVLGR
jgi:drug/metabolite transporter (DMT)-like permease